MGAVGYERARKIRHFQQIVVLHECLEETSVIHGPQILIPREPLVSAVEDNIGIRYRV
jgi:hypothetical protein